MAFLLSICSNIGAKFPWGGPTEAAMSIKGIPRISVVRWFGFFLHIFAPIHHIVCYVSPYIHVPNISHSCRRCHSVTGASWPQAGEIAGDVPHGSPFHFPAISQTTSVARSQRRVVTRPLFGQELLEVTEKCQKHLKQRNLGPFSGAELFGANICLAQQTWWRVKSY